MDKAAESRALSHGVELRIKYQSRFPKSGGSYDIAVGCDIRGTEAQRRAAVADLVGFQTPAENDHIEDWLAELSVITAGRGPDGISAELLVNAYSSRLRQFPADVVRWALLVKTWKWFPTWEELEGLCKAKASPRRHMIAAMSALPPPPEPVNRPPTEEEREAIQKMIDEMFPTKTAEDRKAAVDEALKGDCMIGEPAQMQADVMRPTTQGC